MLTMSRSSGLVSHEAKAAPVSLWRRVLSNGGRIQSSPLDLDLPESHQPVRPAERWFLYGIPYAHRDRRKFLKVRGRCGGLPLRDSVRRARRATASRRPASGS